jgi:hypothetical protein
MGVELATGTTVVSTSGDGGGDLRQAVSEPSETTRRAGREARRITLRV